MNWLILPTDKLLDLDALNALQDDRKISPITTNDGTLLIGADLLGDPFWSDFQTLLSTLSPFVGEPAFPTPAE